MNTQYIEALPARCPLRTPAWNM